MKKLVIVVFLLLLFTLILPAQKMLLPVPYHSQGDTLSGYPPMPNTWCTVACLHMLFDYYDHMDDNPVPPPAHQIASACNTDDVAGTGSPHLGTYADDARRAAHFSMISNSADGFVGNGYSWRKIGYSAIDSTNGQEFLPGGDQQYLRQYLDRQAPGAEYLLEGSVRRVAAAGNHLATAGDRGQGGD